MPQFSELPRELRDMIYTAILTSESSRASIKNTNTNSGWLESSSPDEHGCVYSSKGVPSTCANMLAVNRQVNAEMAQTIQQARKKEMLVAKIDILATFCGKHHITWLSLPLVHISTTSPPTPKREILTKVPVVGRLLAAPQRPTRTTSIEKLQIDVRPTGHEKGAPWQWGAASQSTAWSVCEVLRSLLTRYPNGPYGDSFPNEVNIDTLVVNILAPLPPSLPSPIETSTSPSQHEYLSLLTHDLINVWNSLWANNDVRAKQYRILLEKVERVRVCVGGKVVRERGLRSELERGQRERRRIAERVGW